MHALSRYEIIAELDHGGMASVYLCLARGLGGATKLQVLKCLKDDLRSESRLVRMFLDEGRLATKLNHPNVVQTFEVGIEKDQHFIAMEYLEGQSLSRLLRAHLRHFDRPLERGLHLRILVEAMRGLDYAHGLRDFDGTHLRIVHRDVSPQNVFLTYDGAVKVIDFGIAKAVTATSITAAGTMKGKASYVAPEQARGVPIDRRVDVFAMGMLLWAAAVGRPMWETESDVQRLTDILSGTLRTPRDVEPSVPAELDSIVRRALAHRPDDRYATMRELREAVEEYIAKHEAPASAGERERVLIELFAEHRTAVQQRVRAHVAKLVAGRSAKPLRLRDRSSRWSADGSVDVDLEQPADDPPASSLERPPTPPREHEPKRIATERPVITSVSIIPPPVRKRSDHMVERTAAVVALLASLGILAYRYVPRASAPSAPPAAAAAAIAPAASTPPPPAPIALPPPTITTAPQPSASVTVAPPRAMAAPVTTPATTTRWTPPAPTQTTARKAAPSAAPPAPAPSTSSSAQPKGVGLLPATSIWPDQAP